MRKNILSLSIFTLLVSGASLNVSAQTCGAGFELREVVNIDFGTFDSVSGRRDVINNDEISEGVISGVSYDTGGEVENGRYAVVADPRESTDWAAQGTDHTGQVTPYPSGTYGGMLFVNGTDDPITLFTLPIQVCENTDLQFETWYANAHNNSSDNQPRLTFSIYDATTNTLVDEFRSPAAVASPSGQLTPRWASASLSFNSGTYTNLRLEIKNEVGGSSGNDFVIDDIKVTVCVPIIKPEWSDGLDAGTGTVKVECEAAAVLREIPIALSQTESASAQANGLTWFVWQYSDDNSSWNNFGNITQTTTGDYSKNVEKAAPNGQRAWRLVLATTEQEAQDIAAGKIIAAGCSSGTVTSSIIFECLPCQVPEVTLSTDKTITCIQDGNEIITLTAKTVSIDKEDNWVIDENSSNIDFIWLENGSVKNDWKNQLTVERPVVAPSGIYTYAVRAEKSTCSEESNEVSITINAPMEINLVAFDEAGETLVDDDRQINKTTAIRRDVRLEVISISGGVPQLYEWSWNNITHPVSSENEMWVSPLQTTTYNVVASDNTGCSAEKAITVNVKPLPTAFAPWFGHNDVNGKFAVYNEAKNQPIETYQISQYENLTVYNRYGQEVYNGNRPWNGSIDGKDLSESGTFFYIITFNDGETLKGTIELIKQ
jgi:hypothetical protein